MEIVINDHRKIYAIQEEFNLRFPFLRLEFFSKSSKLGGRPTTTLIKHSSKTLGECRTIHETGNITITPNMTVSNLEEGFANVYGLGIQVLRKSGRVWLGTTVTEGWTLEEQNAQGEELCNLSLVLNH